MERLITLRINTEGAAGDGAVKALTARDGDRIRHLKRLLAMSDANKPSTEHVTAEIVSVK